jgi:hypothetical protein
VPPARAAGWLDCCRCHVMASSARAGGPYCGLAGCLCPILAGPPRDVVTGLRVIPARGGCPAVLAVLGVRQA